MMMAIHIVSLLGFLTLATAMNRRGRAAASLRVRLRVMGWGLLCTSFIMSVADRGLSIGIVTWLASAMIATVGVAFLQTWLKARTR